MYTRANYLEDFKKLLDEILKITTKKNNDYGGNDDPFKNFKTYGELGILVRMSDKMSRLDSGINDKRSLMTEESIEDSAMDLAVYSLILILYRKIVTLEKL